MLIKTCLRTSLIILLITCLGSPAQAQPFGIENRVPNTSLLIADLPAAEPGSMQIERAFPALSFTQPVLMIEIPDGSQRLCVVQKNGQLKAFVKSQNPSAAAVFTFLDISDRVLNAGEQGLLGLAFDPDYAANGEFYWFAQSLAIQFRRLKRIFVCRGCWPGTREEIDVITPGGNFGWRIMEGTLCFKPPQCDPNGLVLSLGDTSASRQNRARAYLAANCSLCHQPGGTASTSLDFRWEINNSQMNAINVPPRKR